MQVSDEEDPKKDKKILPRINKSCIQVRATYQKGFMVILGLNVYDLAVSAQKLDKKWQAGNYSTTYFPNDFASRIRSISFL